LDADKQTITLSLYGSVAQTSGEDWSEVALALSTAQPSRGIEIPDLPPQYLDIVRPMPAAEAPLAKARADEIRTMGAMQALEDREEDIAMRVAQAAVTQGLLAATFTAPRRESIDSSGSPRRPFSRHSPQGRLTRLAAPKLDEQTVLTAKAVNESGPVLLPVRSISFWETSHRADDTPAGSPGDEINLAFGPDDRVKVERKIIERKHETTGVFSKEDLYRYRIRTTVKNLYPRRLQSQSSSKSGEPRRDDQR
jgi:uncharacterized protein (TIGR02231 family)